MNTLSSDKGNTEANEYQRLSLEATKKRNKLLDLEIEAKELELEIRRGSVDRGVKCQD